ncbi:hypothetical protein CDL12_25142 [Handroanthus impetiginosus]|uniref:DUF8040 domain-containing protein n=1 Tax=Handroanthus impetiginosus TaxID=429701 RepID=A0A2G9GAP7_9LAMI|nr:hypothetical protein CDL12_25142 [Handroanthus impetiginosus]
MVEFSDWACLDHIRMNRNTFARLCYLLEHEKVCMFLIVLAHHIKNRIVKGDFIRFGEALNKHYHAVLKAVLKLHLILLVNPKPLYEDCTNTR